MAERTDRELLELAAKALGWRVASYSERRSTGVVDGGMALVVAEGRTFGWSPLHNDGDALRLAVKLRLCLFLEIPRIGVGPMVDGPELYLEDGEDPYAATRRAIVRAAAEIGAKP